MNRGIRADFQGHIKPRTAVEDEAWSDEWELMSPATNVFGEHFAVSFEAATSQDTTISQDQLRRLAEDQDDLHIRRRQFIQ
jgi:hypothetical protein